MSQEAQGGSDAFGAAYNRLRGVRTEAPVGRSWEFKHPDDRRDFDFLASHFEDKVDFGYSPRCEPVINTEARDWCRANLGEDAINEKRWSDFREMPDGTRLLGLDFTYNPDGLWLLVRRTYLFRDPRHAVWFKMVWW